MSHPTRFVDRLLPFALAVSILAVSAPVWCLVDRRDEERERLLAEREFWRWYPPSKLGEIERWHHFERRWIRAFEIYPFSRADKGKSNWQFAELPADD